MSSPSKYLLAFFLLASASSCQKEVQHETDPPAFRPISFRMEVEEGTEGAIVYEYPRVGMGVISLGEKRSFDLDNVKAVLGTGTKSSEGKATQHIENIPMVSFTIAEKNISAFDEFMKTHVNQNVAIEISGEVVWVGMLDSPLTRGGLIPKSGGGHYTQSEAEAVVASLRKP